MAKSLILTLFISVTALTLKADDRPTRPAPEIDTELLGQDPMRFFESRRTANKECTDNLVTVETAYEAAKAELKKLISEAAQASAIDGAEQRMVKARTQYIHWASQCGDCASREIKRPRPIIDGVEEKWYVADGSCYLGRLASREQRSIFERATERLLDTKLYPKHAGGFPAILNFDGIDPATGAFLPAGKIETDEFLSFIAVKGPFVGLGALSFSYVAKNTIEKIESGKKSLSIYFDVTKAPQGFVPPSKIYEITASGAKKQTINTRLPRGWGMWYVTEDGYFRYATAADFGLNVSIADTFAKQTLLEALFSLVERTAEDSR